MQFLLDNILGKQPRATLQNIMQLVKLVYVAGVTGVHILVNLTWSA